MVNYGSMIGPGQQTYQSDASHNEFAMYGHPGAKAPTPMSALPPRTPTFTLLHLAVNWFVPWVTFTFVVLVLSFSMHYWRPVLTWFLVIALVVAIVLLGVRGFFPPVDDENIVDLSALDKRAWIQVMAFYLALAWLIGLLAGQANFANRLQRFYDVQNLNNYWGVDPSMAEAIQVMDAGIVNFKDGTAIDRTKAAAFQNGDRFCAAPLTIGGQALQNYDFWIVGTNCCSASGQDFSCGEVNNPSAKSGLRVMAREEVGFYRLAVQRAASRFRLQAKNPVYFSWWEDSVGQINAYRLRGWTYFVVASVMYLAFQLVVVVVEVVVTWRLASRKRLAAPSSI